MKLLFLILLLAVALNASGQSELQDSISIEEIVVTHSKVALANKKTAKPILIIGSDALENNGGLDLSQILDAVLGIQVNGALSNPGKDKSIYLRGASSEYAVLLLDGQPILDPSGIGGATDIRLFSPDMLEKIEILKGSQSVMYGSDAVSGVVNFVTKKSSGESLLLLGNASLGSFLTRQAGLNISGQTGNINYLVNFNGQGSQGISEALSLDPGVVFEKDGFRSYSSFSRMKVKLSESISLNGQLFYSDYQGDTDEGSYTDASFSIYENTTITSAISLLLKGKKIESNLNYSFAHSDRTFSSETFGVSPFFGRFHNLDSWMHLRFTPNMEITTGIHFQSHGVLDKSTTVPNPQDAVFSPYSTLLFRTSERWNAELGIRYNHHSKFGSNFNYSLASTYWIQDELKLFANYTTGFKAPNLFQLYGAFGANPNLNPLISKAFEVGIAWQVDASMLYGEMAYFRRNVDQIIVFDFNAGYLNQDEQNDQGIEFSVGICPVDQLKMNIQYTFLDGTTVSVGPNGESIESDNLFKRPDHQIEGMIEYSFNKSWNFGITASWSNERPDLFFNPNNFFTPEIVVLEPFLYLTVNANYTISKNLKAYMTIKNLSNASFSEVYGFGTPGINYSLGMNFTLSR